MALLVYRFTPLPRCGVSPAELLMGRSIRSNIPQLSKQLIPQWPHLEKFRLANSKIKQRQKSDNDTRHGTKPLPIISNDTQVWVTTSNHRSPGRVTAQAETPRSYLVETPFGQVRRNQANLTVIPNSSVSEHTSSSEPTLPQSLREPTVRSLVQTRIRTGPHIVPPQRL